MKRYLHSFKTGGTLFEKTCSAISSILTSLSFFIILIVMNGCGDRIEKDDLDKPYSPSLKLEVATRSGGGSVDYPVYVYAFSSDGSLSKRDVITDDSMSMDLALYPGTYRVVAVSGVSDYLMPENVSLEAAIGYNTDKTYSSTALMIGSADVVLENSDAYVNITLSYKVGKISVLLNDVPDDIEKVSVSISPLYSAVKFSGEHLNPNSVSVIDCRKTDRGWESDYLYLFPGSNSQTVISINLSTSSGSTIYGYTYDGALSSATPYFLNGSYMAGFSIIGSVNFEGWNEAVSIVFNFGFEDGTDNLNNDNPIAPPSDDNPQAPSVGDDDNPSSGGDDTTTDDPQENNGNDNEIVDEIYVSALPKPGDEYNGSIVFAQVEKNLEKGTFLLMSKCEWQIGSDVSTEGATHVNSIDEAVKAVGLFSLTGLESGWRLPKDSEVPLLKEGRFDIATAQADVDLVFEKLNAVKLSWRYNYLCLDSDNNYLTYYCAGNSCYPFDESASYCVRAFKKVCFKIQ